MNKRGITMEMVSATLFFGKVEGDKVILKKRTIDRELAQIKAQINSIQEK